MLEELLNIDKELLITINQWGKPQWDALWLTITNTLSWIPFFILLLMLNFRLFERKIALQILYYTIGVLLLTVLITNSTKEIVQRLRPLNTPELIPQLRIVLKQEGYSFFSGHTSNSVAICTFLFLLFRKKLKFAAWIFVWAVPYAFSRMYLAVHFPTDIAVGLVVGLTTASVGYYLFMKQIKRKQIML